MLFIVRIIKHIYIATHTYTHKNTYTVQKKHAEFLMAMWAVTNELQKVNAI